MRRLVPLVLCTALVLVVPSAAWASHASGVSGTVLAKGTSVGTIATKNRGATDVVIRRIVLEPGSSTGWHYHPGEVVAVVLAGTLTRQLDDCSIHVSTAGQAFVEPAGRRNVHIGRNLGADPVELYATYLIPAGDQLAIAKPNPGC